MLTPSTSMKVTESGQYDHAPPKNSGWKICSAAASQPPVDPPERMRAYGSRITRKRFSISGMSSCMIASPYGPLLAEFTAYETSKYGVGCWNVTAIMRGKLSLSHAFEKSLAPSNPYGAASEKWPCT